jgi:Peptidase A4 family
MHLRGKFGASVLGAAALAVATVGGVTSPAVAASVHRPARAVVSFEVRHLVGGQAREFLGSLRIGSPRGASRTVSRSVAAGVTQLQSTNWSGYADSGAADSFTAVSGSWVQPKAKCGSGTTVAVFWVGIDGLSSADPTVEQDGTIVECDDGVAVYADWWETYPGNAVQVVNEVSAGDHISASVRYSDGDYAMRVTDSTHSADSFSVSEPCGASSCENMSSEWIAEAPCCKSGSTVYNLADFGTWTTKSDKTTYDGTSGSITVAPATDEITMVDSGDHVMAQPGALNSAGNSFAVKWKRAS